MPSNALPLEKKTTGKIPESVQGRFSLSLLWDKGPCDTFDWYKYILVGKGPEGTLSSHLSDPFLANLCLNSDTESL